ncbi:hypothetical protein BH09BAC3_BH09BAC3_02550 [soil metagenome]
MLARVISAFLVIILTTACADKIQAALQKGKTSPYEQMDFKSLMRRYLKKDKAYSVEGIYSVSATVTKRKRGFLSSTEKEKVTDRKENYAKVAILRDDRGSGRELIELALPKENLPTYSIIGEFNTTEGGSLLLYKHMEGFGKSSSYTFTTDTNSDIMEGIRIENDGNTTITYKLTYVKLSSN